MYKFLVILLITGTVGVIAFFQYPPYANQDDRFILDKKLTSLPELGTTLHKIKSLSQNKSSFKNSLRLKYKPSCEIEIYNKFAKNIQTKKSMEKYLRRVSSADTAHSVVFFQNKLFSETKFSDPIFNDVLDTNLRKERSFLYKINNRALCSENQ